MAAERNCRLSYDTLVAMIPFVMDFLDLDTDDIIASGILNDSRLDDAVIAMILSHEKARDEKNVSSPSAQQTADEHEDHLQDAESKTDRKSLSKSTLETRTNQESLHKNFSSLLNFCQVDSFRTHYRMNEDAFGALMQDLGTFTSFTESRPVGMESFSHVDMLSQTLRFLGSRTPLSQLAAAANIPEAVYSSAVHETLEALCELLPHYVMWPDSSEVAEISHKFRQRCGLQGVLGTVDVLHVPLKAPADYASYYVNQQKETTVMLQTVCDHRQRFIHCCTGWPGSMKEDTVLQDSDLHNDVQGQVSNYFPFDSYLVGDEAYSLTPWLITPFMHHHQKLTTLQQQFNSACHQLLHNNTLVYSRLLRRFPRLEFVEMKDMQGVVVVILVCCALHNFCLDKGDQQGCDDVQVTVRNFNSPKTGDGTLCEEGESKRQCVLQLLQEL